jgi:hypothetical protein
MALSSQKKHQIAEQVRKRFAVPQADSPVPQAVLLALMDEQRAFRDALIVAINQMELSVTDAVTALRKGIIGE